jgi:hypothetical protein
LLIDNTATTVHLPGPQNPGECHLYFAEGCHLYIALTRQSRIMRILEKPRRFGVAAGPVFNQKNQKSQIIGFGGDGVQPKKGGP